MKKINQFFKNFVNDESAQGATEYILLLVVLVGVVIMFKGKIQEILKGKIDQLGADISSVTGG